MYVCFQLAAFVREHMWHKALLMEFSMRLELTLVSSLNDLWLVKWLYIAVTCIYICVCVCVCAHTPLLNPSAMCRKSHKVKFKE